MDTAIEISARHLFPNLSLNQALAELLLERAQKNLIKYQTASRQFQTKYEQEFEAFRQMILSTEPPFEMEQDYFDWEAAVTGAADMKKEIKRLENLTLQS